MTSTTYRENSSGTTFPSTVADTCSMRRRGTSRLEVLIVVLVAIAAVAIISPSCQRARGPTRRTQCLNRIKNLALAVQNEAVIGSSANSPDATLDSESYVPYLEDGQFGWPYALLHSLDQGALQRHIVNGGELPETQISVLICPEDEIDADGPQHLSYVANAGYGRFTADPKTEAVSEVGTHTAKIDLDGDGKVTDEEIRINQATGVFWRQGDGIPRMTLDRVSNGDGSTNTLLFAENHNAGPWTSTNTLDIAFVVSRDALEFENKDASDGPLRLKSANLGAFGIRNMPRNLPGRSPVPSSNHGGALSVAFCDGRARTIATDIDPLIYLRLMTPEGERFGQQAIDESDF